MPITSSNSFEQSDAEAVTILAAERRVYETKGEEEFTLLLAG
jgi:hypothetical protein